MIGRREFIIAGACAAASGVAFAIEPRRRMTLLGDAKLDKLVPTKFGEWSSEASDNLVKPNSEGLAATLYSELVSRIYRHRLTGDHVMMLIAYGDTQSDVLQLHRPESCYPALGLQIASIQTAKVELAPGAVLPVRRMVAQGGGRHENVVYWTRIGEYLPATGGDQRRVRLKTAMEGYVPDGVLVRLSAIDEDAPQSFALIDTFLTELLIATPPAGRKALVGTELARAL